MSEVRRGRRSTGARTATGTSRTRGRATATSGAGRWRAAGSSLLAQAAAAAARTRSVFPERTAARRTPECMIRQPLRLGRISASSGGDTIEMVTPNGMPPRPSAPVVRLRPAPARGGAPQGRGARWINEEVGRLLFRARRALWSAAAGRLETHGESVLAWQLLNQLQRCGPGPQREIAERTAQHPTGVSRLLEDLERGGDVRPRPDPSGPRQLRRGNTGHRAARRGGRA